MADKALDIKVDPKEELRKALRSASKKVDDLTIPLTLISQQWFKSNRAIFSLKSPGKYTDLSELYKKQKQSAVGFIYPILKSSGLLEKSITEPGHPNAISYIINKKDLVLGTNVEYASYLHEGTSKMPERPVVLFGNEQVAPGALNNRVDTWKKEILRFVKQVSGATDGTL